VGTVGLALVVAAVGREKGAGISGEEVERVAPGLLDLGRKRWLCTRTPGPPSASMARMFCLIYEHPPNERSFHSYSGCMLRARDGRGGPDRGDLFPLSRGYGMDL